MGIDIIVGAQTLAPAVGRTLLATIKNKKKETGLSSEDPGYAETLNLMRQLLAFTSACRVEELEQMTNAKIPRPPSVIIDEVTIPDEFYPKAAHLIQESLGPANLNRVGKTWWQWRRPGDVVKAEWVEMKADRLARKKNNAPGKKIMLYIHGGAYCFGGLGHGYQIQRHARKLKGRVFAPRYRLAPQFPFPCAVQDVLSTYLYLLTIQAPETIVIAGDSAGGGLCLSLLLILRDRGLPLPAGASLISPWVDLTHSFPSITIPTEYDYVPVHGFHAKPSMSWPPPNTDELKLLNWPINKDAEPDVEIESDGQKVVLKDQFQMYAPNLHLQCPLVSGILAPSLGGLCPLQVIVGGGEVLRDEQIYLAHKAADPERYPPSEEILERNGNTIEDVWKYPPTEVQLLVFDDGPHAATMIGHTRTARYEYRAVAQFASWALSRAQNGNASVQENASISSQGATTSNAEVFPIGKPGDPIPPFVDHMVRKRVDSFGVLLPLEPATEIRACNFPKEEIGWPKEAALKGWFEHRKKDEERFASQREKVWKQRVKDAAIGYERFPGGEVPPPSALAGRRVIGRAPKKEMPCGNSVKMWKSLNAKLLRKLDRKDSPEE